MKRYKSARTSFSSLLVASILALNVVQPSMPTPVKPVYIPEQTANTPTVRRPGNKVSANLPATRPTTAQNRIFSQPAETPRTSTQSEYIEEKRQGDFLVAEDGIIYPIQRYAPALTPNDSSGTQWWTGKVGLPSAWNYGPGQKQTVLAIIDTGFALSHEEFADRLYENSGEKGMTTQQQSSRLNCAEQGKTLDKACNVIDDNFDGIVDNEVGTVSRQNRSLRNCTDQGIPLDKSCNMVDDDGNGLVDDLRGWDFVSYDRSAQAGETNPSGSGTTHGTQVAGVAAASGNNSKGIAGVDWYTKILPIQALDDDSYGDTLTVSRSIRYAADRGADVISISLGASSPDSYLRQAIAYAISKGSIIVASAGNDGCQCISYPARYDEVVAVGSTDSNDAPTSFSNWGDKLDVIAPGVSITSPVWASANQTGAYSSGLAGTSFSAPLVASLLSLARSHQPNASSAQLVAALTEQTNRLSIPSSQSRTANLGYGRADAAMLLERVKNVRVPVMRYAFGAVSGGNFLAAYEPIRPFSAYTCENDRPGTTPTYRLSKGTTTFYTISEVERYQALAQGYTATTVGNFCLSLPTDTPQLIRTISITREFENREPVK